EDIVAQSEQQIPRLGYDSLVYALGSLTGRHTVPRVDAWAYTLAPSGPFSAAALREELPPIQAKGGQVESCGGEPAGVETAAEFAQTSPCLKVCLMTQDTFGSDPLMRSVLHLTIYAVGKTADPQEEPAIPVRMSAFAPSITGAHGADCLSNVLRGNAPKPLSFAYLGQGIALGRHNAVGCNKYPDDRPHRPYLIGRVDYWIRDWLVRFLATAPRRECRPGSFIWPGKSRCAAAQRRQRTQGRKEPVQLHQA